MVKTFHVFTLLLVAIAMALSLAHALEFPGKLRLSRDAYIEVQSIYYPGFTLGGMVGDAGGLLALAILTWLLRDAGSAFWWLIAAFALLAAMNLVYWVLIHPVNGFWLRDTDLGKFGGSFFSIPLGDDQRSWTRLRDIWEYSHLARAVLAMGSFLATAIALTA
ncbi:hypothetical protein FG93_05035 [Bosea sp. LC85]|uniref:hypothetical protein n=1 Tax=Bosea sp. LC85 TaxID=1502851 RepID=UPI0004E3F4D9|nr:hypothetical protein [Bosea sp. LC85]KFC65012.1 hypothetical protein FG93_05035 [Bosea sp. LC85]